MTRFDTHSYYIYSTINKQKSMSKRTFFKRYIWLLDLIKNNQYISFDEIAAKFKNSDFTDDDQTGFSKRTFHRDQIEIIELFGVEIKYDKSQKGYYLEGEYVSSNTEKLIDSYRLINTFQIFKNIDQFIVTELNRSGSEHLLIILDAIQKRKRIAFNYCKYVDVNVENRIVEPYFVKEFKNRWYVIAKDTKDDLTKTFALERIVNEPYSNGIASSFDIPPTINSETYFKDSFGIFRLSGTSVENIELMFTPLKGRFIKSQPIHKSQQIIVDTEIELRIKLKLQVTHDFIMEILSHGSEVKVISPQSLRETIIAETKKNLLQYE